MMPVPAVTRQARRFQGEDGADAALTHGRQEVGKPWTLLEARTTAPSILINGHDFCEPQRVGALRQGVLPPLTLLMGAYLMAAGLAERDVGGTVQMGGIHLGAHGDAPGSTRRASPGRAVG